MTGLAELPLQGLRVNFTYTTPRGMPLRVNVTAVRLDLCSLSMYLHRQAARVSTHNVMAWIALFADSFAQKAAPEGLAVVLELYEMRHFLYTAE